MFLISHSMGPILGNAVPHRRAAVQSRPCGPTPSCCPSLHHHAFWVFPFLLKWGWCYEALVMSSVVDLNFCILWSCYFYGGVSSPTLPWLLIIPILSLFYIGGERRLQPASARHLGGCSFVRLPRSCYDLASRRRTIEHAALRHPRRLGIVSTTAALCYVATMAIYYARIFDSGIALETEVRRRRETMDELRKAVALADRAGNAKAEFLARMSHELRNAAERGDRLQPDPQGKTPSRLAMTIDAATMSTASTMPANICCASSKHDPRPRQARGRPNEIRRAAQQGRQHPRRRRQGQEWARASTQANGNEHHPGRSIQRSAMIEVDAGRLAPGGRSHSSRMRRSTPGIRHSSR